MNYMIGLLELNPFEVLGDSLFPKRYCSQVIIPLIDMLKNEGRFRVTLNATGSAVEYLAESHPLVLRQIRALVERGQAELLCSTYTNADWQVFPSSDLRRSHRMTDAILRSNSLPVSRTMTALHNTYWPAMASFQEEFDIFLVRDAFLKGRHAPRKFPQIARVGKSLLIVAANNILHEMTARLVSKKETNGIGSFTEGRLETAVEAWTHSDPRFVEVGIGEDTYHWFHSAGAHHFTTGTALRNWDAFFCDPDWMRTIQHFLTARLDESVAFSLVSEFTHAAGSLLDTLPDLGDAGWGFGAGSDHAYWLEAPEQRMRAVLSWTSLSWRSRTALRKAETLVEQAGQQASDSLHGQVDALWRRQLWTEVAPVPTRANLPCEADFIREHAEHVIGVATEISFQLGSAASLQNPITPWNEGLGPLEACEAVVETELINGEGTVKWFSSGNGLYRCEARFAAEESACGVGFKLLSDCIDFSSCGQENEIAKVALTSFDDGGRILPSATGLYSLGNGVYLIRHNRHLSVGAQVALQEKYLRFIVEFVPEGRHLEWPFTIVKGNASTAIAAAHRINAI